MRLLKIIEQNVIIMRINRVHSMNQTLNLRTSNHQKTNFFESTLNVSFFLKPLLTVGFKIWDYSHSIVAGGLLVISYKTLLTPFTSPIILPDSFFKNSSLK